MKNAALIETVRAISGDVEPDLAVSMLLKRNRPRDLSGSDLQLAKRILSRGVVRWIVQNTWSSRRCLCDNGPLKGRLWSRHPAGQMTLRFTSRTGALIQWLSTDHPVEQPLENLADSSQAALGDHFVIAMTVDRLRHSQISRSIAASVLTADCPMTFWTVPEDVPESLMPDSLFFRRIAKSPDVWSLEVFSQHVARAFSRLEVSKWGCLNVPGIVDAGRLQGKLIESWVESSISLWRFDFLLPLLTRMRPCVELAERVGIGAANRLIRSCRFDPIQVQKSLMRTGKLLLRMENLAESCRAVGYFEENYAAAQLWLSAWENSRAAELIGRIRIVEKNLAVTLGAPNAIGENWR